MKRFILIVAAIFIATASHASELWLSSTTATADTTKRLCPKGFSTGMGRGKIHGVCVGVPVLGLSGSLIVYNSSGTTANPLFTMATNGNPPGCNYYDVGFSSGTSYSTVSTATVTILYSCGNN